MRAWTKFACFYCHAGRVLCDRSTTVFSSQMLILTIWSSSVLYAVSTACMSERWHVCILGNFDMKQSEVSFIGYIKNALCGRASAVQMAGVVVAHPMLMVCWAAHCTKEFGVSWECYIATPLWLYLCPCNTMVLRGISFRKCPREHSTDYCRCGG